MTLDLSPYNGIKALEFESTVDSIIQNGLIPASEWASFIFHMPLIHFTTPLGLWGDQYLRLGHIILFVFGIGVLRWFLGGGGEELDASLGRVGIRRGKNGGKR